MSPEDWDTVNETINRWNDWDKGIHPVSLGHARWLPIKYVEAMHAVRDAVNECNAAERRRIEDRARGF